MHHRLNGRENVAEELTEFVDAAAKAGGRLYLGEKLFFVDLAGFKPEEQGRVVDEVPNVVRRELPSRGDSSRRDAVVEVHQDLPQIKRNRFWLVHVTGSRAVLRGHG